MSTTSTPADQGGTCGNLATSSAVVHLEYDVDDPPPVPSSHWTRFVCISDNHTRVFPVPNGDVLLHAGDLTNTGRLAEFRTTVQWLRDLPHSTKIIIAGNHDLSLDHHDDWYDKNHGRWHSAKEDVEAIRTFLTGAESKEAGIVYLENEQHHFQVKPDGKTWSVYGSPWTPYFCNWGFNYQRGVEADRIVRSFPKVDILLTHGPPARILDRTRGGEAVGCESLSARAAILRPRLHVFGHIHEDRGGVMHHWPSTTGSSTGDSRSPETTVYVNAANWPAGPKAHKPGQGRVAFGTGSFQPIIVDLLDDG